MAKFTVRFLVFSMLTTSLLMIPIITQAEAATTGSKHIKKKRARVVHQRPGAANPSVSPYSTNRYEDDPDRKAAGGGY